MEVTDEMKRKLAYLIVENIKKEFHAIHLSGNLVNTIKIYKTEKGWAVDIPAQIYDLTRFRSKGEIVYKNSGSYADRVNHTGGYSGTHKKYVDKCIENAVSQWMYEFNIKGKVR